VALRGAIEGLARPDVALTGAALAGAFTGREGWEVALVTAAAEAGFGGGVSPGVGAVAGGGQVRIAEEYEAGQPEGPGPPRKRDAGQPPDEQDAEEHRGVDHRGASVA
jgi:hypothetical protein